MAAPNAPMPLVNQIKGGTNIVVTVVLRGMGGPPTFTDGGTTFNSGDPTATYTISLPTNLSLNLVDHSIRSLLEELDNLGQKGYATVT